MAIERVAPQVDFGNAPQAGAVPINVNNVAPDPDKFYNGNQTNAPQNSFLDGIINAALPAVNKIADKVVSDSQQEAYIKGQSAAASGLAQDSVDTNIFTKDWATAGYSDTRARLALSDAEAQTAVDMPKLAEQSPDAFQTYLAQRRQKLAPMMEGMSIPAQQSFVAQQLTSDQAAIAKQAGAHQKFIVDQLSSAIQTDTSVRLDAMTRARTDVPSYLAAGNDAYVGMYGNIWNNPNLDQATRQKLTTQAATLALAQNHQVLYEKMRDNKLPGTGSSMLDQLPFDDQVTLSKAYEQSRSDTATMRLASSSQQMGLMQSDFDNPLKPALSYTDFKAATDQWTQDGLIKSPDQLASLTKSWADGNEKKQSSAKLAQAYSSGDVGTIFGMGKSESDGYTALIQTNARNGVSVSDTTAQLLNIGINTGQQSAFKGVGELTRSAVSSIGTTQTIDPNQLQMLNTVLSTLDTAQKKGNTTAMAGYLSSFGDADRAKIMTYRESLARTGNPQIAAADAANSIAQTAALTDDQRNVLASQNAKSDVAIAQSIEPKGLWAQAKDYIPDFLRSNDAINTSKISTGQSWFENPDRVQAALAPAKAATLEELQYISRAHPYASDDSRKTLALAAVADRTLVLDGGPLVTPHLPTGTSIQSFFGVNSNIRPDVIAAGIDGMQQPAPGNRVIYKIDGQAQLQWQELAKDGSFVKGGTMDPKMVAGAVQDAQDKISNRFNQTDGAGITMKGDDGTPVTFNGNNTAGAESQDMLDFRTALVKHEGVTAKPYDDLGGKVVNGKAVQTVGVGVSSHNANYPAINTQGTADERAISDSFMRASNDAAVAAVKTRTALGLTGSNGPAFKLLAELSYQGGSNFPNVAANKPYVQALKDKDVDGALTALKNTVPYQMSGADRRSYYETLTRQALSTN